MANDKEREERVGLIDSDETTEDAQRISMDAMGTDMAYMHSSSSASAHPPSLMTSLQQYAGSGQWTGSRRRSLIRFLAGLVLIALGLVLVLCVPHPASGPKWSSKEPSAAPVATDGIPLHIWQVGPLSPKDQHPDPGMFNQTLSWHAKNPAHLYTRVGLDAADAYVASRFSAWPEIVTTFRDVGSWVLRSDLLRYLILLGDGGFYSDLDTVAWRPIHDWIPAQYQQQTRAIVGLEYDRREDDRVFPTMTYPLQFCQWTIAAAPGHPILGRMVDTALAKIRTLTVQKNTTLDSLHPNEREVFDTTGPAIWTEVVSEEIALQQGRPYDWRDFSSLRKPKLVGDILVLPINAFGNGQWHSGSQDPKDTPDALVQHLFSGGWKGKDKDKNKDKDDDKNKDKEDDKAKKEDSTEDREMEKQRKAQLELEKQRAKERQMEMEMDKEKQS